MKTQLITLATIFLFSLSVSAKTLIVSNFDAASVSSLLTIEDLADESLCIDEWMLDDEYWNQTQSDFVIQESAEESLHIESWMINNSLWENSKTTNKKFSFESGESATEAPLTIESWMTNDNSWSL